MLGSRLNISCLLLALSSMVAITGGSYQAPTIAHIHLGHTVTGADGTPGNEGYLAVAEQSANEALDQANQALEDNQSLPKIKQHIANVNDITNGTEAAALTGAIDHAMTHIRFAAESDDASDNVRDSFPRLEPLAEGIFYRSNLIKLYSDDLAASGSKEDARVVAELVQQLTYANLNGEDLDEDGKIGSQPREIGMQQLQTEVEAMLEREEPPYVAVDRWYLLNLIRLPNGQWIFRPAGSSAARGY
jgi:hypothetical protein